MFTKTYVAPNGANTQFHSVKRIEAANPNDFITAHVQSFLSQDDALSGTAVPSWNQPVQVPKAAITGAFDADIEQWLVEGDTSPFRGAAVVAITDTDLAAAKVRQWARVKGARNAAIASGFESSGKVFDSDLQSQVFILGSCLAAIKAISEGAPADTAADTWTCADNSEVDLSLSGVIQLAMAFGEHTRQTLAAGRVLRATINAATTVEEAEAAHWVG